MESAVQVQHGLPNVVRSTPSLGKRCWIARNTLRFGPDPSVVQAVKDYLGNAGWESKWHEQLFYKWKWRPPENKFGYRHWYGANQAIEMQYRRDLEEGREAPDLDVVIDLLTQAERHSDYNVPMQIGEAIFLLKCMNGQAVAKPYDDEKY